ncbi:sensor histidine kinase [Cohnella endophytica]|uniref:Sensor histidine kinase n=1 Tax=Cohnella endophytica TaxID=2419778 RepID=A0A494Y4Y1_9BACL|nr:sensor histidine kinase [Cohnella endophytica]RKP57331.1 sensor histidine kinase [Cohnella endophytica]
MNRFFEKYRNMLIRKKINVVFIPIVILPLLVVIFTSNSIFTQSSMQRTEDNIAGESSIIATRIQSILKTGETSTLLLVKNINLIYEDLGIGEPRSEEPGSGSQEAYPNVRLGNKLVYEFDYNLRAFKDIESIAYIDNQNNVYVSNTRLGDNFDKALESDMVRKLQGPGIPDTMWFPMTTRDYLVTGPNPVLTVGKRVVDFQTGQTLGVLIMNIKESTISSIFPEERKQGKGGFYIADRTGKIIATKNAAKLLKQISEPRMSDWILGKDQSTSVRLNEGGDDYLIMKKEIPERDWILYKQVLVNDITKDKYTNSITIIIVGLICIAIALIVSNFLSRHIAKPIVQLTKVAKQIREGNLNTSSQIRSNDEAGILSVTFNEMIGKIKNLLHEVTAEQKKKREYELALIQAQIKPHFFYNTLDLIFVLCEQGKTSLAADTTKALADYYRISLSNGKEIISIREELKNAEDYLFIQKTRYSDILDFRIEADNDILDYSIMKLTLQPLVENSIYHGLKPRMRSGQIVIKGYLEEGNVILKVIDNGVGFQREKLEQMGNDPASVTSERSFGLRSVSERIKLYYGDQFGIHIRSQPDVSTEITLTIPQKEGAVDHD